MRGAGLGATGFCAKGPQGCRCSACSPDEGEACTVICTAGAQWLGMSQAPSNPSGPKGLSWPSPRPALGHLALGPLQALGMMHTMRCLLCERSTMVIASAAGWRG